MIQKPPSCPASPLSVKTENPKPLTPTTLHNTRACVHTHTHTPGALELRCPQCQGVAECLLRQKVSEMPIEGAP